MWVGTLLRATCDIVLWDAPRRYRDLGVLSKGSPMIVLGHRPGMLQVFTSRGVVWVNDFKERFTTDS